MKTSLWRLGAGAQTRQDGAPGNTCGTEVFTVKMDPRGVQMSES